MNYGATRDFFDRRFGPLIASRRKSCGECGVDVHDYLMTSDLRYYGERGCHFAYSAMSTCHKCLKYFCFDHGGDLEAPREGPRRRALLKCNGCLRQLCPRCAQMCSACGKCSDCRQYTQQCSGPELRQCGAGCERLCCSYCINACLKCQIPSCYECTNFSICWDCAKTHCGDCFDNQDCDVTCGGECYELHCKDCLLTRSREGGIDCKECLQRVVNLVHSKNDRLEEELKALRQGAK